MQMGLPSWYRIMWIFCLFDLPTKTKQDKFEYTRFRKYLLKDGFQMLQYSVYIRHCGSRESMEAHVKRVESMLPKSGKVTIMMVTDKQFADIRHYWGVENIPPPGTPSQLEMF